MKDLQSVKGMHDLLPEEIPVWHWLEANYRSLVERFGYSEIRTPILEPLELFIRSIGETTDIVEKEMYAFVDKGGDNLALRPEGTASLVRAYIQHGMQVKQSISKWYYIGPMFRRERPAKGRFRQFYQAGAELFGVSAPTADFELIDMAVQFVRMLGLRNEKVQINTLGGEGTRGAFRDALIDYFFKHKGGICGDCRRRLNTNPLRVLDCKVDICKEASKGAPSILDYLSDDAKTHFDELRRLMDRFDIPYEVVPSMVRGLDYYTKTIFEIQADYDDLGSQTAIVGGGRYDNLVRQLGGSPTPAVGFSFGIERLVMVLGDAHKVVPGLVFFVAGVGDGGIDRAMNLSRNLREMGYRVETSYEVGSLKSQLKRADKIGATITIIAGEDEYAKGAVTWRDMKGGRQELVPMADLSKRIKAHS